LTKEFGTNLNKLYLQPNFMRVGQLKHSVEEWTPSELSIIELDLAGKTS